MSGWDSSQKDPERILVVRCLAGLGDMLCAVPALRALRARFPEAAIDLLGLPGSEAFVSRFRSYLDGFVEFTGFPGIPELPPNVHLLPQFLREVQSRRYDLAIQMQGDGCVSNQLVVSLGAAATAGFFRPGAYCPDERYFLPYPDSLPEWRRLLALTSFLGAPDRGDELEFPITPEEHAGAGGTLEIHGVGREYALVSPGAQDPRRRWDTEGFAKTADALASRGLHVLLGGTLAEAGLTKKVASAMKASAVDLAGKTRVGELAALIAGSRLLVSNDSGPSHLASATRTPSVVVFSGHSDPTRWMPADRSLHRPVMPPASVEAVLSESEVLLNREVRRVPTGVA